MNRLLFTVLFLFCCLANIFGQTKYFELIVPTIKTHNSLYNTIILKDDRKDSGQIGIVQTGLLKNNDVALVFKPALQLQLSTMINALTDSSAQKGKLLLQLQSFNFIEKLGSRFCYLKANLFAMQADGYKKMSFVDTILVVRTGDITGVLTTSISEIITDWIAKSLLQPATDTKAYTIQEVANMDSIDKSKIPVYVTENYVDGLYSSFQSFTNQLPDKKATVEINRDGEILSVKVADENGKLVKVKSVTVYAVINKGRLFIATQYGYYHLDKLSDDFYFTGDINIAATNGEIRSSQFAFGILGGLSAKAGNRETYQVKLDYIKGKFIHIRRIETEATQ